VNPVKAIWFQVRPNKKSLPFHAQALWSVLPAARPYRACKKLSRQDQDAWVAANGYVCHEVRTWELQILRQSGAAAIFGLARKK
jgi:hypothetical protein